MDSEEINLIDDDVVVVDVAVEEPPAWRCWEDKSICLACYPWAVKSQAIDRARLKAHNRGYKGCFLKENWSGKMRHLTEHSRKSQHSSTSASQKSITHWVGGSGAEGDTGSDSRLGGTAEVALLFAALNLSFRCIEHRDAAILRKAIAKSGGPTTRKGIKALVEKEAAKLRAAIFSAVKSEPAIMAIDGGTILRTCYLNFCFAAKGRVFFLKTLKVQRLDKATVQAEVNIARHELESEGINVVGLVTDNASAMMVVAEPHSESDDNNDDGDADAAAKPLDIHFEEDSDEAKFFYHVRCWCHSFQLVLKDAQKKSARIEDAFDCVTQLCRVLCNRKAKSKLNEVLRSKGVAHPCLQPPAVTRWNSFVRCMVQVLPIAQHINQVVERASIIDEVQMLNLKIAVLVLAPVCWATDVAQSDHFTAAAARDLIAATNAHLEWLKTIAYTDGVVKREIATAVDTVIASINARLPTNFRNRFNALSDFFDPTQHENDEMYESVAVDAVTYWEGCKVEVNEGNIREGLMKYKNRNGMERQMSTAEYWNSKALQYSTLAEFATCIGSMLQSEACVERSFMSQSLVMRPDRNRLGNSSMNAQLFLKINAHKLDTPTAQTKGTPWLCEKDWRELALCLAAPEGNTLDEMVTRSASRHTDAMNIQVGSRVAVAFKIGGGESQEFFGTVVSSQRGKYRIVYDSNPEKVEEFLPLTQDNEYRIL